jgi:hypothetical protein
MLITGLYTSAQPSRPPTFAVHHTYSKEDSIPPGNAFTVMDQLDDGSEVAGLSDQLISQFANCRIGY